MAMIEQRLGQTPYFAGAEFSAADVMMSLPRFVASRDLAGLPNVQAYVARIAQRPAYRRASEKAEPGQVHTFS